MNFNEIKKLDLYRKYDESTCRQLEVLFTLESKSHEYLKVNRAGELEKRVACCALTRFFWIHWHARSVNVSVNKLYERISSVHANDETATSFLFNMRKLFYFVFGSEFTRKTSIKITPVLLEEEKKRDSYDEMREKLILISSTTSLEAHYLTSQLYDYNLEWHKVDKVRKKLDAIEIKLKESKDILEEERLSAEDMKTIRGVLKCINFITLTPSSNAHFPYLESIRRISELFSEKSLIYPFFYEHIEMGDVLFTNSIIHTQISSKSSLFFACMISLFYHRSFHSYIFNNSDQTVLHLPERVDHFSFSPPFRTCLKTFSVDFSKVFKEFNSMRSEDQNSIIRLYRQSIETHFKTNDYANIRISYDKALVNELLSFTDNKVNRPKPLFKSSSPQGESEMCCSGFIAGFVFEALEQARDQWNLTHPNQPLTFNPNIVREVTAMTPLMLRNWGIWKEKHEADEHFEKILAPDLLALRAKS